MKKIIPILIIAILLVGCGEKEAEANKAEKMDRAVFAWEGVDEDGMEIIQKYEINTILLDYNHTDDISALSSYHTLILAGSPEWGTEDMEKVVEEAEGLKADGLVFDIEGDYERLAANLESLATDFPVYVCIPFWLDTLEAADDELSENGKAIVERIIKATDGVFVMNYLKGNEMEQVEFEYSIAQENNKKIWTIYELQPAGTYDLQEYNTYYSDGIAAVEENYKSEFSGIDVGLAFHNLKMMEELDE